MFAIIIVCVVAFLSHHTNRCYYTPILITSQGKWGLASRFNPFPNVLPNKKAFENIVGKGENADEQHFLLFPRCFPILMKTITII